MANIKKISTTKERLREAMTAAGKKQVDLVNETGLQKSAISRYLSGEYEPKQDAVYLIARALDVSEMWLWGYDVPMERPPEQKKSDQLAELIDKLRADSDFFEAVVLLSKLSTEQYESVKLLMAAALSNK